MNRSRIANMVRATRKCPQRSGCTHWWYITYYFYVNRLIDFVRKEMIALVLASHVVCLSMPKLRHGGLELKLIFTERPRE